MTDRYYSLSLTGWWSLLVWWCYQIGSLQVWVFVVLWFLLSLRALHYDILINLEEYPESNHFLHSPLLLPRVHQRWLLLLKQTATSVSLPHPFHIHSEWCLQNVNYIVSNENFTKACLYTQNTNSKFWTSPTRPPFNRLCLFPWIAAPWRQRMSQF